MEQSMLKNLLLGVIGAAVATSVLTAAAGVAHNDQSDSKTITLHTQKVGPVSGKQMYATYCAQCHGLQGKGNGPFASALKTQPANLTLLSKNNGGKFPAAHIVSVLQYGVKIPAHGTADMPIWGTFLGNINEVTPLERPLRISNLSRYLETMQAK
jgi:mono/diheme cytochrome c family protein